jgi:uncharacterized protein
MTPQERQLIDDLFDRLAKLENAPRDPEAMSAIMQGLRKAPNAVYALVQTALVQDEALKRANDRIQQLEAAPGGEQNQQPAGFLDSMRNAIFGQDQAQQRGSVPPVRAPDIGGRDPAGRPVWNSGQAMQSQAPRPGYAQPGYGQPQYGQPQYGQPQYGQPYGSPFGGGGGGGSFLGTAAAAAAGVVGGGLLLNSIRGMMGGGGSHQAFADTGSFGDTNRPWSDQSGSDLARDAGVNDIGSGGRGDTDSGSRAGLFDQASNDDNYAGADHDSDGFDDDGGGDDGGSDYA